MDGVKKFAIAASRNLQENIVSSFTKVYSDINAKFLASPSVGHSTSDEIRMQVMMDQMLELEAKMLQMSAATNVEANKMHRSGLHHIVESCCVVGDQCRFGVRFPCGFSHRNGARKLQCVFS